MKEKMKNFWQTAKTNIKRFFTKEGLIEFYNWNINNPFKSGFVVAVIIVILWKLIF